MTAVVWSIENIVLGIAFGLTASLAIAAIARLTPKQDDDPWGGREGEE